MEHYLLCLLNSIVSEEDHKIITNYLDRLFPSQTQYRYIQKYIESVAVLLKPISKHVAVLSTCEENKNITWKLIHEDEEVHILDIIENEVTKTDSAFEFDSQDANDYISDSLHSLADQLPAFGTYKLDILLGSDVLKELSVCKEPALAGAFIRLTRWHSAYFSIFEQKEFDFDRLNEWCEIMNAQLLLQDSKIELGPPLWRGSVQFNSSDCTRETYKGFQLKLHIGKEDNALSSATGNINCQLFEHIILSSKLEIFEEVHFVSIPTYFITPIPFELHLSELNLLNEKSTNFIEYLLSNEQTAFIARLEYNEMKEKSKPERKYSLRSWQKMASLGDIKDSECFVSLFEKFITFVITKSTNSRTIVAYPLKDPESLDASFYFRILKHRICSMLHNVPKKQSNTGAPLLSENVHQNILHEYLKYLRKGFCNCKINVDISSLIENISSSSADSEIKKCLPNLSVEEIDPSDWPERIQLLHKQMQTEEEKEGFSSNPSVIQNLRLPQQSYSLSSKNIIKHFLSSGEGKNSENLENISLTKNTDSNHLVTCSLNEIQHYLKWPEIMNYFYHDLYYNNSIQKEDKENLGSQLVRLYVQHETASTCNNQQLIQNVQITVSGKVPSPSKAFRGPSLRIPNISHESEQITLSPRKNHLKELITQKILSTSTFHSKNFAETDRISRDKSKKNIRNKSSTPVRCSPRKKNPVNYNYSSINRNNENKNSETSKMSDLLRRKLRCAVAKALEDNGISATHELYQSCGAKLLTICRTFLDDLKLKKGKTSEYLQKIADAHVKQVIEFYKDS